MSMVRNKLDFRIDIHGGADINYAEYDVHVNEILSVRIKINPKECLVIRKFKLNPYSNSWVNLEDTYRYSKTIAMHPDLQQVILDSLSDIDFTQKSLEKAGFKLVNA